MSRATAAQAQLLLPGAESAASGRDEGPFASDQPVHPLLDHGRAGQLDDRRGATLRLLRLAIDLGAPDIGGPLTDAERTVEQLAHLLPSSTRTDVATARASIGAGADPLGERLCALWPASDRRSRGAFYTDRHLIDPMIAWSLGHHPDRFVDPGCGSGRFAASAARRDPALDLIAIDLDPIATLLTRAHLAVVGARSATVLQADYTTLTLPASPGKTAFVGNPPYVRHHDLSAAAKTWAVATGRRLGHPVSALAGLHAHFYLATALHARPGDVGCFVTSAEWIDVGYGAIIRDLLLNGLGGSHLHIVDPRAVPFSDAMTTAAIACFEVGADVPALRLRLVESTAQLASLHSGERVARAVLRGALRWSPLLPGQVTRMPEAGTIPLRQVARVHRGLVTGANRYFVLARPEARALGLERWCRPVISSAREIFEARGEIRSTPARKLLLEVPADIDRSCFPELDAYLRRGEQADDGREPIATRYVTSRRHPWWFLGPPTAPPLVVTYMARQAPAFAANPDGLALINIAHGIYPRAPLSADRLRDVAAALNGWRESFRGAGRTYHGGLEKFEPGEVERLPVPARLMDPA